MTGAVQYLPDLDVPGMVWGKILRTQVPHARITRLDTSRAEALPGVLGVVTGRNVEQRAFGYAKDHFALKGDVVRCIRDEVAAVAAETEEIAAEACRGLLSGRVIQLGARAVHLSKMRERRCAKDGVSV